MKKQIVASLAAAMVISAAGTSFAATNPFVDVPARSWAYDAVTQLAKDGIVDGYGDGKFQGDKTITRYEMAQIVARAMAREDKANAKDKDMINKLAVEFASELEALNVRVTNVENRLDNVKWGGEFRERLDNVKQQNTTTGSNTTFTGGSQSYVDMWATAQINPNWIGKAEYESTEQVTNSVNNDGGTTTVAGAKSISPTRVYVQGGFAGGTLTLGKFDPFSAYGLVIDDNMTGAQFQFGNKLQARIAYGKYTGGSMDNNNSDPATINFSAPPTYAVGELDLATSKATNFKFAYHNLSNLNVSGVTYADGTNLITNGSVSNSMHITEAGFDTKLGKNLALMGTYSKNNLSVNDSSYNADSTKNSGYFAQLTYKAADLKVAGSYDLFANYRNVPVLTQLDSTWDYVRGMKGAEVGIEYVPAVQTKITAFYLNGKDLTNNDGTFLGATTADPTDKVYRAQVEFFF